MNLTPIEAKVLRDAVIEVKYTLKIVHAKLYMFRVALATMTSLVLVNHYPQLDTWYWYILLFLGVLASWDVVFGVIASFLVSLYTAMKESSEK